jgi:Tfp pilus assembly protein PilF
MKKLIFLIVDNDAEQSNELKKILGSIGHEDIEITDNANDAWTLMRIKDFDCVISAWDMPDMTGIALLRITRNDDNLHFMPFFLTDTTFTKVKVIQAGQAGVTGLMVKPFDLDNVGEKIKSLKNIKLQTDVSESASSFDEGMRLIEQNDYNSALKVFEELTQKGETAEAYYNIGYIKTSLGEYEAAIVAFRKATQLDRLFAKAFEAMGRAYKELGMNEKAQEYLQKAADIYIGREKMQDAESVLNEILEISPDSINVYNSLGVLYRRRGDLKTSLNYYQKALKVHPKEPHIHYNIGRLFFELKLPEKARVCFNKALALDPNFKEAKEILTAMEIGNI